MARFAKTIGAFVAVVALGATLSTAEAGGGGGGGGGGWGGGKGGGGGWGGGGKTWGGGYGKGYGWGKGYGYGVPLAVGSVASRSLPSRQMPTIPGTSATSGVSA
jgi:hypothetical protein